MQKEYSEEQKKDIEERVKKVIATMQELEITIGMTPVWIHKGEGEYVMKLQNQYVDLKYNKKPEEAIPSTNPEVNPIADEPSKEA